MNNYENAKKILEKYNQQQIIDIANKMPEEKKQQLANQVQKIDFEEVKELYEKTFEDIYVDLEQLQPIRGVNPDKLSKEKLDEYEQIATKIIKPNNLITIINPEIYAFTKQTWFIESIDFVGNNKETTATLNCVLPEVYNMETPEYFYKGINLH